MLRSTLHTVLFSVAQMLYTILYIVMCNLWFTMLRKMWTEFKMRYIARNVIQTVYHNVVPCLKNVKHNVVQAVVDNDTLNLARTVIQCRTNHSYAKMLCTILYIIVCNLWFTVLRKMWAKFKLCAVFCKVLHVQTVVDNAELNMHTMLKKSQKCCEQCWKQYSTNCFSLCRTKKGYNVVSCIISSSA